MIPLVKCNVVTTQTVYLADNSAAAWEPCSVCCSGGEGNPSDLCYSTEEISNQKSQAAACPTAVSQLSYSSLLLLLLRVLNLFLYFLS